MARKAFTEHPKFMDAGHAANCALAEALGALGITPAEFAACNFDDHASRVVDDLTRLLLRAYDAKQAKAAA